MFVLARMTFREYARYFYLKYMKFLQHRNRVRMVKTAIGGTFYTLGAGVTWYQSASFGNCALPIVHTFERGRQLPPPLHKYALPTGRYPVE